MIIMYRYFYATHVCSLESFVQNTLQWLALVILRLNEYMRVMFIYSELQCPQCPSLDLQIYGFREEIHFYIKYKGITFLLTEGNEDSVPYLPTGVCSYCSKPSQSLSY